MVAHITTAAAASWVHTQPHEHYKL